MLMLSLILVSRNAGADRLILTRLPVVLVIILTVLVPGRNLNADARPYLRNTGARLRMPTVLGCSDLDADA